MRRLPEFDGCELVQVDPLPPTPDDRIAAVVLFADVDTSNPIAVERRTAEWWALFDGL